MSLTGMGNAYIARQKAELEHKLFKEEIAEIKEDNWISLKLRRQAGDMLNEHQALDDSVEYLFAISKNESSYMTLPQSGKTTIKIAFDLVGKEIKQYLKELERVERSEHAKKLQNRRWKSYTILHDTLSDLAGKASNICDMIHRHNSPANRYKLGSERIQNFVRLFYNPKIKGDYLC